MAVSIADVAERAKVSISTVSRVVNGRNVVNETDAQARRIGNRRIGYRPNVFARGLMLKKSNILGLVLPDLHGEFYSEVIRGANLRARQDGYHLLVSSVGQDEDLQEVVGGYALADGVAVMVSDLNARTRESLDKVAMPIVVMEADIPDTHHDTVVIDQRRGAVAMMRHLVRTSEVRRVIFVGGEETNIDSLERYEAYRDVMAEAKLPVGSDDVFFLDFQYRSAYKLAEQQLQNWCGPHNCVFAANDEMAAGIVHAALSRGISIADDLRVVGFDDTRIAKLMRPALTTVRVPMSELGATAIELLCKRQKEPERARTRVTLQSELVIRGSCGLAGKE